VKNLNEYKFYFFRVLLIFAIITLLLCIKTNNKNGVSIDGNVIVYGNSAISGFGDNDISTRLNDIKTQNKYIYDTLEIAYSTTLDKENPSAAISILVKSKTNRWEPLQNGQTLSIDDNYKIMFNTESSAYFYIFQIDSNGKIDWLFPINRLTSFSVGKNPVSPNIWTYIPGQYSAFHLDNNWGVEHIFIIGTKFRWHEIEELIEKACKNSNKKISINKALNLKMRGIAGIRYVESLPDIPMIEKKDYKSKLKDIRQIITGKQGILVYERWFLHVSL